MKKIIIISLILVFVALLFADQKEDLQFAVGLYRDKNYELAKVELNKFLANYPQSEVEADVKFLLGNIYLAESFEATTTLTREVTVPPGAPDNNFGFNTLHREIVQDIFNGDLPTDGQTLRYWREEFRSAVIDNQEGRSYNGKTLLEMVYEINSLSLKSTYSFTPGNELIEAYEILLVESTGPYNWLVAALLATELNHTVGRGLVDQEELQLVLISWGEALLAQDQTDPETDVILVNPDDIAQATRLFGLINTGGGGGIDE